MTRSAVTTNEQAVFHTGHLFLKKDRITKTSVADNNNIFRHKYFRYSMFYNKTSSPFLSCRTGSGIQYIFSIQNKKATPSRLNRIWLLILICIAAIPYAGIIRVRFKGYILSHHWHPWYGIY